MTYSFSREQSFQPADSARADPFEDGNAIRGDIHKLVGFPGAKAVRTILRARTRRSDYFNSNLFGEPAWDMLLELYAAELEQKRIAVGSLCLASGVPATTALRWINALTNEGLLERRDDPFDARRAYVSLTTKGLQAMFSYLATTSIQLPVL